MNEEVAFDASLATPAWSEEERWVGEMALRIPEWVNVSVVCIFLTEAAERFNYYGISSLLTLFLMKGPPSLSPSTAAASYSCFSSLAYLAPLLGSALASSRLRMFWTILIMSVVYLTGMILLPFAALVNGRLISRILILFSLLFVATGTGGIKPNVAAFGALQVDKGDNEGCSYAERSSSSVSSFFVAFYFVINVGSISGQLSIPAIQRLGGHAAAFATAACVLLLAILLFTAGEFCRGRGYKHERGRNDFVGRRLSENFGYAELPDWRHEGSEISDSVSVQGHETSEFSPRDLIDFTLTSRFGRSMQRAYASRDLVCSEQLELAVRALRLVAILPLFWAGYSCMNSIWIQQADAMDLPLHLSASQWTAINPVVVLIFLPVASRFGSSSPAETQITVGMVMGFLCLLVSSIIQWKVNTSVDGTARVSGLWTLPQWIGLSISEVLTSVPSLALCYGRAPKGLQSSMQAAWLVASAAGSFGAALVVAGLGAIEAGLTITLFVLSLVMGLGALLFAVETQSQNALSREAVDHSFRLPEIEDDGQDVVDEFANK